MDELRQRLEKLLREPVTTADEAERTSRIAAALADYLRVRGDVERVVDGPAEPPPSGRGRLAGLTLDKAAQLVLEDAGCPLHATELGKRMKAGGWSHPRSTRARSEQVVHQIAARLPKYPDRFVRVGRNTFGLTVWGDASFKARPIPRVGLFAGAPARTGRSVGDASDEPVSAHPWR